MDIITFEGEALKALSRSIDRRVEGSGLYRLRVARDGDSIKFKLNEGTWSPPYQHVEFGREVTTDAVSAPAADLRPTGHRIPTLTLDQLKLLRNTIKLEDPYVMGTITDEEYQQAYADARNAGLEEVLETTAQFFTMFHYNAEEITATAETLDTMTDLVADAYTRTAGR
jgi:hypothetical protein